MSRFPTVDASARAEATEHLIDLVRAATEPLHGAAIGSARNVASALLAAPEMKHHLDSNGVICQYLFDLYDKHRMNGDHDRPPMREALDVDRDAPFADLFRVVTEAA